MKATVDGLVLFEQLELKAGSWRREAVQRTAAGLDGIVSVDLGCRSRQLVGSGVIRAFSDLTLKARLDTIRLLMDGATHTLTTSDGRRLSNLRIDAVSAGKQTDSGSGVSCAFEIRFTQLGE